MARKRHNTITVQVNTLATLYAKWTAKLREERKSPGVTVDFAVGVEAAIGDFNTMARQVVTGWDRAVDVARETLVMGGK